jgi:hypothetical protein
MKRLEGKVADTPLSAKSVEPLETNMTLFSPKVLYRRIAIRDRRISSDTAFGVWASVVLIGLAIVSVTLGVAPVVDPTPFPIP